MLWKNNNTNQNRLYENGGVYIPRDFEYTILRHVLLNNISFNEFRPSPMLLLQGKKGEGKSFMTETILKENNIVYKFISSSALAGQREGDAVQNLFLYYNSVEMNPSAGKFTVLVIDDFHLSIAVAKGEASYTTNADNLLSALMNIADRKEKLKAPIILIGNDFSKVYAPLVRAGRMSVYTWEPTSEDKVEILYTLLKRYGADSSSCNPSNVSQLVSQFNDMYISFFEQAIENVFYQNFSEVTAYFSEKKGKVSYSDLNRKVSDVTTKNKLTLDAVTREARLLSSNARLRKLDG